VYEGGLKQIYLFNQELSPGTSKTYSIYFKFQQPEDLKINFSFESVWLAGAVGLFMVFISIRTVLNEREKLLRRGFSLLVFLGGLFLIVLAVILYIAGG
jgi:hypothetical protein